MKRIFIIKGLVVIFCLVTFPKWTMAKRGKPFAVVKINYTAMSNLIADTTLPKPAKKKPEKKEEETGEQTSARVVKVIPKARRQPVPVPVKVDIKPVKIIKLKIVRPLVKPVIKILH